MERQFITAVPAYGTTEAGEGYRGLMPLLGEDMSDEMPTIVGLTLVEGNFTTWVEMHRMNFRCEPEGNILPRVLGGDKDGKTLHERWMQWINDSMFQVIADNPDATISDLERVVRWGGVVPFKITGSTCSVCARPGSIVPVIAPMCWPSGPVTPVSSTDDRIAWDYQFPAEHLRVEAELSHDRDYTKHHGLLESIWEDHRETWTPYEDSDNEEEPWKQWSLSDLYENGYEDEVHEIEEQASEEIKIEAREKHADIVHIPHRVRHDWIDVIDRQAGSRITQHYEHSRQIVFAVEEGLRQWRGATGH